MRERGAGERGGRVMQVKSGVKGRSGERGWERGGEGGGQWGRGRCVCVCARARVCGMKEVGNKDDKKKM